MGNPKGAGPLQLARVAGVVGRPPARDREARRRQRREAFLDAALRAVERHGDDVTMTAMAAAAGVTKPVLYRYFGDRAGLYQAVAERFAAGLLAELRAAIAGGPGGRASVEQCVDAYLRYVESHRAVHRFVATRLAAAAPDGQRLVAGFVHLVAGEVARALRPPLQAAGVDAAGADLVAFALTGLVQLGGEQWLERTAMSREDAVARLSAVAWHGLVGLAGEARRTAGRPENAGPATEPHPEGMTP